MDADEIRTAVLAAARGQTVIAPQVQSGLASEIRTHAPDDEISLTQREQEILQLVAEGLSAPDIGRQLYLSAGTVKTHLRHIYEKFGVSDRGAVVAEAMRRGFLR
jgi:two-component system nitrate/nitrite response regulator NarL